MAEHDELIAAMNRLTIAIEMLIQAMSEEADDEDQAQIQMYLDGTPVKL